MQEYNLKQLWPNAHYITSIGSDIKYPDFFINYPDINYLDINYLDINYLDVNYLDINYPDSNHLDFRQGIYP